MVSKGDKVFVKEHGGKYKAEIINTDKITDPKDNQLYELKVLEIISQPDYDLQEGELYNAYPKNVYENDPDKE